jgi:hypothetical protein
MRPAAFSGGYSRHVGQVRSVSARPGAGFTTGAARGSGGSPGVIRR